MRKGTFSHCGTSKASLIEHHGRYVFQTAFFLEKYEHRHVHMHLHIHKHLHTQTFTYTYIYIHIHKQMLVHIQDMYIYMHVRVRVCLFFCCVVPCHVVCALFVVGCVVGWYVVVVVVIGPWSFQLRMMSFLQRANDWASSWTVHGINSSIIRWTFFQSLSLSSRREDFMDTYMGKSQETKNIIWLIN